MALLVAGYWPTTYFPDSYWLPDYWLEYGTAIAFAPSDFQLMVSGTVEDVIFSSELNAMAQEITYTTSTGAVSVINAIIFYAGEWREYARYTVNRLTAHIRAADIGAPSYRDYASITMPGDGSPEIWYVDRIVKGDDYSWWVSMYREERPKQ